MGGISAEKSIAYGRIWSIAWPIIVGSAAQTMVLVTDTAVLSRLGHLALGAEAIAGLIYLTLTMIPYGFAIGMQIVVARRYGEGRERSLGRAATHSFTVLWAIGLAVLTLATLSMHWFLPKLAQGPELAAGAEEYFKYRIWGFLFISTNVGFRALYVGLGRTKVIAVTTVIMLLVNFVLDIGLVFGLGPLPEMGLGGAAIASVIAELVCMLTFVVTTRLNGIWQRYRLFRLRVYSLRLVGHLLRVSLPLMLQNFLGVFIWMLFFVVIATMGVDALATSNVVRSIYMLMMIPVWGISSATNTLVSYVLGRGEPRLVWRVIRRAITLGIAVAGVSSLIIALIPDAGLALYTGDVELVALSRPIIWLVAIATLAQVVALVIYAGVTGTGATAVALIIDLCVLPVYLFIAWLLAVPLHLDLGWVWCVEIFYPCLVATASLAYLKWGKWSTAHV